MPLVQVLSLAEVSADHRRTIYENDLSGESRLKRVNVIKARETGPQRLGDHHHDVMNELLLLAHGKVELLVVTKDDVTERIENINAPALIPMPTGVDHTVVLAPGSVLVTLVDRPFDPTDMIGATDAHKAAVTV